MRRMFTLTVLVIFLGLAVILPTRAKAAPGRLETAIASLRSSGQSGWVAWSIPMARARSICCQHGEWSGMSAPCSLDSSNWSWSRSEDPGVEGELRIFLKITGGAADRLRLFSSDCPLESGRERVEWVSTVSESESLAVLAGLVDADRDSKIDDQALAAIAIHQDARAETLLVRFAGATHPVEIRKRATFWLGQRGTDAAVPVLKRLALDDPSREVRKHAIFAISQSDADLAAPLLREMAEAHPEPGIRSEAIFWLGQSQGAGALSWLRSIAREDPSSEAREKAIFAISQIDGQDAVRALIDVAKNDPRRESRKRALFWLGQKAGKEAAETLERTAAEDPDAEIQKAAVFGISQLAPDEAIPRLVRLATSHQSRAVRKQALFWLGQSDDPRALEAIERILLGS